MERTLFVLQRITALLLAPFVVVHVATILYAVRGGLTGQEILARTQGNTGWIAFYVAFVVCVAIHVPIGMRNVLVEWGRLSRQTAGWISLGLSVIMLVLGMRAVIAIGGHWA